MKKFLFMMLGALMSLPAMARDFCGEYNGKFLWYTIINNGRTCETKSGGLVSLTEYKAGNQVSGSLTIGYQISDEGGNPYWVVGIGRCGFCYCEDLTSVTLTEGICYIDEGAFEGCTALTSVSLP